MSPPPEPAEKILEKPNQPLQIGPGAETTNKNSFWVERNRGNEIVIPGTFMYPQNEDGSGQIGIYIGNVETLNAGSFLSQVQTFQKKVGEAIAENRNPPLTVKDTWGARIDGEKSPSFTPADPSSLRMAAASLELIIYRLENGDRSFQLLNGKGEPSSPGTAQVVINNPEERAAWLKASKTLQQTLGTVYDAMKGGKIVGKEGAFFDNIMTGIVIHVSQPVEVENVIRYSGQQTAQPDCAYNPKIYCSGVTMDKRLFPFLMDPSEKADLAKELQSKRDTRYERLHGHPPRHPRK